MKYEELTRQHLKELVNFYVTSFNAPPWNDEWTEESASKRLSRMLNCEGAYGLVCYEENKMVGMILGNHEYYYTGMHFEIKEFCIDGSFQGKGVGSNLLEVFTKRLQEKGIDEVILLTTRDERTEGFYQRRGFKTAEDMVLMGKKLV